MMRVADRLTRLPGSHFAGHPPVRRAWNGTEAGPSDAVVVVLRSRRAPHRPHESQEGR